MYSAVTVLSEQSSESFRPARRCYIRQFSLSSHFPSDAVDHLMRPGDLFLCRHILGNEIQIYHFRIVLIIDALAGRIQFVLLQMSPVRISDKSYKIIRVVIPEKVDAYIGFPVSKCHAVLRSDIICHSENQHVLLDFKS